MNWEDYKKLDFIEKNLLKNLKIETFPFSEGEIVLIKWTHPPGVEPEQAIIDKVFVNKRGFVCGVNVRTEKHEKPFGVNHSLFDKINYNMELNELSKTIHASDYNTHGNNRM